MTQEERVLPCRCLFESHTTPDSREAYSSIVLFHMRALGGKWLVQGHQMSKDWIPGCPSPVLSPQHHATSVRIGTDNCRNLGKEKRNIRWRDYCDRREGKMEPNTGTDAQPSLWLWFSHYYKTFTWRKQLGRSSLNIYHRELNGMNPWNVLWLFFPPWRHDAAVSWHRCPWGASKVRAAF